ncbi:hypothetical protein Hanom_Chr14g01290701 [Helianthus anomalus]
MKLTFIHFRDYPSDKRANHREHTCNFQKLGTISVILLNHRDYPCITAYNFVLHYFSIFLITYLYHLI